MKTTKSYFKLVRDRIPEIIAHNKCIPVTKTLSDEQFRKQLWIKLREEIGELRNSAGKESMVEELADVSEVLSAIAKEYHIPEQEVNFTITKKKQSRGGFDTKTFLIEVVHDTDWDVI